MADQDLNLRVNLEGASQASSGLAGLIGQLSSLGPAAIAVNQGLELMQKGLDALRSPFEALQSLSNEAIHMWQELRELSASTGGTLKEAEDMKDIFELAGLSTGRLGMALFRLNVEMENGGKKLQHMGIDMKDAAGNMMNAGEVFMSVRDKLSHLGSAQEKASAASQLWGARVARGLLPILTLSAEKFEEHRKKAEENGAMTEELAEKAEHLKSVQADLAQKTEKLKMMFAEMIALPVSQWFAEAGASAVKAGIDMVERLTIAYDIGKAAADERGGGFFLTWLGAAFIDKETANAINQANKLADKLEEQNRKIQEKAAAALLPKQASAEEIKFEKEKEKAAYDSAQARLKSEATINQELSKMRTGSDQEAIQNKMRTNSALIALAEENYQKERAIEMKKLGKGGKLTDEEEFKLSNKRDQEVAKLKADNDKLMQVDMAKARIVDAKKLADDEIKVLKETETERIAVLESARKREQAILDTQNMVTLSKTTLAYYADVAALKASTREKIDSINQQIDAQKKLAAAAPLDFEVQKATSDKIRELGQQRAQSERDANDKILESRKSLVDKLKQEADKQANIGASLEEKALRNLEKQGKTDASMQEVQAEIFKMRQEAQQTTANYGYGGKVNIEQLRDARGLAPTFGQLAETGITASAAIGMNQQKAQAQISGRMWEQVPAQLQDTVKRVDEVMGGMGDTLTRMTAAIESLYDGFSSRMIRELEFQAARR